MQRLRMVLDNGATAEGEFGEWVLAILGGFTPAEMTAVFERLEKIQAARRGQTKIAVPAPRHVVMPAEPGVLGAMLAGR